MLCMLLTVTLGWSKGVTRPKLVVGIVVDQMRWDYLYYYSEKYSDDGLKRLLSEGFSCENTMITHVPTITANMQRAITQFVEVNCGVAVQSVERHALAVVPAECCENV